MTYADFTYDYPLLNEPALMSAVLVAASRGPATLEDALAIVHARLRTAQESPGLGDAAILERLGRCQLQLLIAGCLENAPEGGTVLTERGRELAEANPGGVDSDQLMAFESYRNWVLDSSARQPVVHDPRFDEGLLAYQAGQRLTDCPYTDDTAAYLAWLNGWFEARDEEADGELTSSG